MSVARHHAEWLSLVEQSGPFLSMPVLLRVLPQGLDAHDPDHHRQMKLAHGEWEADSDDPATHRAWVRFVLGQTLEMPDDVLAEGQAVANIKCEVAEHGETLRPDLAVLLDGKPCLLVHVYRPEQNLDRPPAEAEWKASCGTRMMELLHAADVRLGLVTNGEQWMLVYAPRGETTGFASWYASYWIEEPITFRAFRTLLSARRFFGVPEGETLAAMLKESAENQHEVTDQLGYPVVIPAGSVYVTQGTTRRATGTHYTPRSLTEPIVRYTLEPLIYDGPSDGKPNDQWRLKSARELLALKVCDIACGSGAFLVEACRYLSERLVEAWQKADRSAGSRQGRINFDQPDAAEPAPRVRPRITPFGEPAKGRLGEQIIPDDDAARLTFARRLVAQRCLYGVDKNAMAVEIAKLSLWLLTLAKGQPFTFLDHAVRHGDSLVGVHVTLQPVEPHLGERPGFA